MNKANPVSNHFPRTPGERPPFRPPMPPGPGPRSYMPGLARFLTQAMLEKQLAGEHPYAYANNNPCTYIDPSGQWPVWTFPPPGYIREAFNGFCGKLGKGFTDQQSQAIRNCVKSLSSQLGVKCDDPKDTLPCMAKYCNENKGNVFIEWGPKDVCCTPEPDTGSLPCAHTEMQGNFCIIQVCMTPGCVGKNPLGGTLSDMVTIHELSHCCGYEHSGSGGGPMRPQSVIRCNDILAICIERQLGIIK